MRVNTICPYCGVGCGLTVEVNNGVIEKITGWREHASSKGRLCIKGRYAQELVRHEERLRMPLIREKGGLREASWSEALQLIGERLKKILGESGGRSIGMLTSSKATNEDNYVLQKFARVVLRTNNVDHSARLCHATTSAAMYKAFGWAAMTNHYGDFADADVFLVVGANPSESHPVIAMEIKDAMKRGAKLIVMDPRATEPSEKADVHLQLRPGSDVAVLNAMMRVILKEGFEDRDFIRERTQGFEELKRVVEGYTTERASEVSGVDAERIREAARLYGEAKRGCIILGMGAAQHVHGTDNVLALCDLAMMTGNIGREGTGINPLRGHNNVQGACDVGALPAMLPGHEYVASQEARKRIEELWGVEPPAESGLTQVEMFSSALNGEVRGMYIVGENPALTNPNMAITSEALEEIEFLVVQDVFLTETAEHADVVLPATYWAEKDGTTTNTDRRVQRVRKIVEKIGDCIDDWEIACALASAMGYAKQFRYSNASDIFEEIRRAVPQYSGITWELAGMPDPPQWPCADGVGTPILYAKEFPIGRGVFHPVEQLPPAEAADDEYPYILTTGRVLTQFHTMTRRSRSLNAKEPRPYAEINPMDAKSLGIEEGETVRIRSRRGSIELQARVSERPRKGVVFVPFHYREAAANLLTGSDLDPVAKEPEYKVSAVSLEKKHG